MADETNPAEKPKELTPQEKQHEGTKKYMAALEAGDKKLAAQIYDEYKLPYSVGTHS